MGEFTIMSQKNQLLEKLENLAKEIIEIQTELKAMRYEMTIMRSRSEKIMAQVNRWKGGFLVVVGLGAFFSWLSEHLFKMLMR